MSRISPPDITQDALARSPAPAPVAADRNRQAEFERALNSKPDASDKRRAEVPRKFDIRAPGKTPQDASRPLDDEAQQAEPATATDREPIRQPHLPGTAPETAAPDEKATQEEPVERPETDQLDKPVAHPEPEQPPTPQPPAGIVTAPPPSTDRPKPGTNHRDSATTAVKNPEQSLPVMPGVHATSSAPEAPSDPHDTSDGRDEQPPFDSLPEDPKPSSSSGQTPGDKLLARLLNATEQPPFSKDLGTLVQTLQLHIQAGISRDGSTTLLQVNLAQLGQVDVQLAHSRGQLHVEIQASPGSLLQLQLARGDLMERLQRLNPGQPIQLTFTQHQHGGDQGSRQRRHVYDEWKQDS
ncbi:type III secretion system needle length determinant [Pseudomonas sp. NPDC089530]|uniref:type III secretion system needle length determinant n=1 Tax=Pseudomonas sp. NPDC089530 TaxID=3390651 RepID=UPI003D04B6CE